ncbi:hypothetical protein EGW08_009995 [Elysia chlorotica]|uniref:DUF7042 domain-containing protein n=1 Tax=Elysia chlorotica TaxID=188477 RepID=A0A433TKY1_ELYCH|nr:hypothetical protein EGW08_009995 [Elysia chlorotica]
MTNMLGNWGKSTFVVVTVLLLVYGPPSVAGFCTFPSDLSGEWVDSIKGSLYFNQSTGQISGYEFATFGTLTLTCWMLNDTVYIFESSEFEFYSLNFTAYFCWNLTQVNSDMFYFYEYGNELPDAGNERVQVYLPAFSRQYNVMCANSDIGLGTYRILYRNNTLANSISNCPVELQAHWNYTVTNSNNTDLCTNDVNKMDLCTDPMKLDYNSSECSLTPGYTENGTVNCLFHVYDIFSDVFYLAVTQDGGADGTNTFLITCMIVSFGNPSYLMGTQYPTQCPKTQNDSYVPSPGAYVSFIRTGSCSSTFPWWIIAASVGGFLFLLLIIAIIIWCCCCRERDEKKKKRLMDEDEDERFNPDLFSRGDRPPYVSISIMDGKSSGSTSLYVDDGEGDGYGNDDAVDGKGEKEPSDAQKKKEDAQKRRLDKRKRVFVIDKDGQVKKMWKEERDSPDSGLEEDQLDGDGKGHEKETDANKEDDEEFAKKHGRKSLKSAQEIQEKGDRRPSQDKTRGKMAGLVSARRSARLRQSARSGPSKLRSEASWGSSNGDFEEVNFQEEEEEVFAAAVGTAAAAATVAVVSENDTMKGGKGGKGKTSKDKKIAESSDGKNEGVEKAATKTAEGGIVAKTSDVPNTSEQEKKPHITDKAKDSKLKSKAPEAQGSQDVKIIAGSEDQAAEGATTDGQTAGSGTDAAKIAAVAAPAAAAVPAGMAVAARVDHKQKEKAELRRLMVEKKQKEKEEKLKEKERLRLEKEERLKKQKEEREARLKREREEKKKAPIKKKYLSEASETPHEVKDEAVEKKTEKKVQAAASGAKQTVKAEEIAAVSAAAAVAPVVLVVAAKGSKKSKKKVEEPETVNIEQDEKSREKNEQPVGREEQHEIISKNFHEQFEKHESHSEMTEESHSEITTEQENSSENTQEQGSRSDITEHQENRSDVTEEQESHSDVTEEQESRSETTEEDDSGRDSEKSLDRTQDETTSSVSGPVPAAAPEVLPEGLGMRREQSIMLDLDRTQSQLRRENSDLETPVPGHGHRALNAVAEMMETARSQVEGRGLTEEVGEVDSANDETNMQQTSAVPVVAAAAASNLLVVHPGLKDNNRKSDDKDAKAKKSVLSQTSVQKQPGGVKVAKVKQISVSEAKPSTVPTTVVTTQPESEDSSSEESEEEAMPVKKRVRPVGFMFPNENMAAQTFKTTGEVINAKPVRAKKKRRMPRKTSVDHLPDRTNQAFGLKVAKSKNIAKPGKVAPIVESEAAQAKKGVPRLLSVKELPAVRASAAPLTIKDLSKKPPVPALQGVGSNSLAVAGDAQDGSASPSTRKGRSESSSPVRRTPVSGRRISEADNHSQLKLMTRLMSQSEVISEVDPSPRHSVGSRRSGKTRSDQLSRHSDPPPPRGLVLEGLDEMDGVLSLTNGSCTPDELKTPKKGEIVVGRPPTQHNYRRPSRDESPKRSHAVSRSHSDSRRGPPPLSHRTQDSDETRFVKFREGVLQQLGDMDQQELNRILYPGIKRYPDTPEHFRRGVPAYKSLNALQRIHRKKYRQVAPEPHVELPPIMNAYRGPEVAEADDPRMRNWLEELYSDKKFFDKSLALPQDDPFIQDRAQEGRDYLLNRARFWSQQQPLVRPGTKMGTRASPMHVASEPGSAPSVIQNSRSKSDERQRDWRMH